MVEGETSGRQAPLDVAPREAGLISEAIRDRAVEVFRHLTGDEQQLGTGGNHRGVAVAADRRGNAVGIERAMDLGHAVTVDGRADVVESRRSWSRAHGAAGIVMVDAWRSTTCFPS